MIDGFLAAAAEFREVLLTAFVPISDCLRFYGGGGLGMNTAFRWRCRFQRAAGQARQKFKGIVKADALKAALGPAVNIDIGLVSDTFMMSSKEFARRSPEALFTPPPPPPPIT